MLRAKHLREPSYYRFYGQGGWHGWGIVEDAPYAASARTLIAGWIRAHA